MKTERVKNASRNAVFGVWLKLYQVLIPFFMKTAIVSYLGMDYLGLNGLFTSILQVLNLAELGVGSAMVFSMYKPIAEDDTKTVRALLSLYRKYYRWIGNIIAVVGICLVPFLPKIIHGSMPDDMNLYVLYLLNLSSVVLSYWFMSYKSSILTACQRNDVISKVMLLTETVKYVLQFLVLVLFKSYYLYVAVMVITQILCNLLTAWMADKMYPEYRAEGELPKEAVSGIHRRIRDLFTAKLGGTVVTTVDTLVISSFLGLTILGIYQSYHYVLTALFGLLTTIMTACMAGIGNSLVVDKEEKVYGDFKLLSFLLMWVNGICVSCLWNLYQPFMKLWMGKDALLPFSCVVLFCIYFLLYSITLLFCAYKDAAGIWHQDRFRPLVASVVNLSLNIIFVRRMGITGIITATVISYGVIIIPWLLYNLFHSIFSSNRAVGYLLQLIQHGVTIAESVAISNFICSKVTGNDVVVFVINGIISVIVSCLLFTAINYRSTEFLQMIRLFGRLKKGKHRIA